MYSSADVHLDYFRVIAIVKRIAIDIGVHVFLSILIPSGYMQRSGVSGSYDSLVQVSQGISKLFCIQVVPVCVTSNSVLGLTFLHSLSRISCL